MDDIVIELKNITKKFPGVKALDDVSLKIRKGEIHGLIGENGAGKSTLIKVLTGVHKPNQGSIILNNHQVVFNTPIDAKQMGIACVYQELNIVKDLSVTDNIFAGNYKKKKNGLLDYKYMNARGKEIMNLLDQSVDLNKPCGTFGIGMQQMVEIAKAIVLDAKVIILDEPTASLGEKEASKLFTTIRKLKDNGVAILFVSHKLEEIFELCDSVTVMRDSKHIITAPVREMSNELLIKHMVGRTLDNLYPKIKTVPGDVALEARNLTRVGEFNEINFAARKGEILGFYGLVGAGRTEIFRSIFAVNEVDEGEIYINGEKCIVKTPKDAINRGIAFLTEDRKNQGLVLDFSVGWNLSTVIIDKIKKFLFIEKQRMSKIINDNIKRLRIKVSSAKQTAKQLSGGNQQKVVIGKWTNSDANIFIFDEPTKGIDVGAKIEVYNIMNKLVKENKCVVMVSSELNEILGMCDRVYVMRRGRITSEISRQETEFNDEEIMKAAWGIS